jgi:hypothetical protein
MKCGAKLKLAGSVRLHSCHKRLNVSYNATAITTLDPLLDMYLCLEVRRAEGKTVNSSPPSDK